MKSTTDGFPIRAEPLTRRRRRRRIINMVVRVMEKWVIWNWVMMVMMMLIDLTNLI
jgi:hypothetical protein